MKSALRASLFLLLTAKMAVVQGEVKNGFELAGSLVPEVDIVSGGPRRDGIPAIDAPEFVNAPDVRALQSSDRVLGIVQKGVAKAYPVAILNWHEIVNDSFGGEPIVVTYCPLCGTGIAYSARVGDQTLNFGVSGLLYKSDMLLYDRTTESLWSQILRQAISGPMRGERLQPVPLMHTSWADWKQRHPDSLVLSTDTGYAREYDRSPYAGYEKSRQLYFPVAARDSRYHPKEWVLGIEIEGHFKAYPFVELEKAGTPVRDTVAGHKLVVNYDRRHATAAVTGESGEVPPAIMAYWFAWYAFHPDTEVYRAP